jgi:hypothetical protein
MVGLCVAFDIEVACRWISSFYCYATVRKFQNEFRKNYRRWAKNRLIQGLREIPNICKCLQGFARRPRLIPQRQDGPAIRLVLEILWRWQAYPVLLGIIQERLQGYSSTTRSSRQCILVWRVMRYYLPGSISRGRLYLRRRIIHSIMLCLVRRGTASE